MLQFMKNKQKLIGNLLVVLAGLATIGYGIVFFATDCFGAEKTRNFNIYFGVILAAIIISMAYIAYLFVFDKEISYKKMFLVLGTCWGLAMQLTMPPCSGPDETEHIINAFHASNTYLGLKDQEFNVNWKTGTSYFYMRAEDMEAIEETEFSFPLAYYVISNGNIVHCKDNTLVRNYTYPARFYRYIFSGLGIAIGRILNLGFIGTLMLGRIMNTLVYVLVGYLALSFLPKGKLQMLSYLLLPTVLELCNCYSYDNFSILFAMLLLALCLYYSKPEVELRLIDMFFMVGCLAMLAPNKYVYVTFVIWIFMIPFVKWKNWLFKKRKPVEFAGIVALIGSIVFVAIFVIGKIVLHMINELVFKKEVGESIEQVAGVESYTLGYILAHPIKTFVFCVQGIIIDFWKNLKCVVGFELGDMHLNAPVPVALTVLFMVIIVAGVVINFKKGSHLSKKQIIIVIVGAMVCLTAIFIGCLVRFTPVDGAERAQVSYRYLVPFYMALVVLWGTDEQENKGSLLILYGQNILLALTTISLLDYLLG